MASVDAVELSKYGKRVYINISRRGWAIVIMPDEIRIDNYHKEPHIHFKLKGIHIPIKYKDLEDVALVVELHLDRNRGIDKKTLVEELL